MGKLRQVYKITYPNGRIYVGSDVSADNNILYVGSPSALGQIADDHGIARAAFPRHPLAREAIVSIDGSDIRIELPRLNLVLVKTILWQTTTVSDSAVRKLEMRFIRDTGANNPEIGYNKIPKYRPVPILSA